MVKGRIVKPLQGLDGRGWVHARGGLAATPVAALAARARARHDRAAAGDVEPGWVPSASSLPLGPDLEPALELAAPLLPVVRAALGDDLVLLEDHCWLRRQYPPQQAPAGHYGHGWHQEGALGFDFLSGDPRSGLIDLVTLWMPLVPCGRHAPGLELVDHPWPRLVPLAQLPEPAWPAALAAAARLRPVFEPVDALRIAPGTLHRTARDDTMTRDRISVGLRFVPAGDVPPRLAAGRLRRIP